VRYSLEKAGLNSITIKVSGEHKGESVSGSRMIYVRAKTPSTGDLQVTAR